MKILYWALVGTVLPLFLVQQVCWIALRRRKLRVVRWRRLTRTWLAVALAVLVVGLATGLVAEESDASVEIVRLAVTGGLLNALVAGLHLRTVSLLARMKADSGSTRAPSARGR